MVPGVVFKVPGDISKVPSVYIFGISAKNAIN